MKTSDQSSKSD